MVYSIPPVIFRLLLRSRRVWMSVSVDHFIVPPQEPPARAGTKICAKVPQIRTQSYKWIRQAVCLAHVVLNLEKDAVRYTRS